MNSAKNVYLMALLMFITSPANGQESTTQFSLNIKFDTDGPVNCTTKKNEPGICVPSYNCNNEHEIQYGGVIETAELRFSSECKKGEWCCSEPKDDSTITTTSTSTTTTTTTTSTTTTTTTAAPEQEKKCFASSDENDCPWCVKLYRSGRDPFKRESGLFCLGALIGSQTIVTTATCLRQAQNQVLWVQVPNSANPNANYTVVRRIRHPKYNSGTLANDIGILSTLSEIEWQSGSQKGACIDIDISLLGQCLAAIVDENDNIVLSPIYATKGSCFNGGNVPDAACGHGLLLDMLLQGTPIMCPKDNLFTLAGLTKTPYGFDSTKALLGNLPYTWLTTNLRDEMGLSDIDYLFNLNY